MKRLIPVILVLLFSNSFSFLTSGDEVEIFGIELEKLLNLLSGVLSLALMALTLLAFRKTGNRRLLFVSLAFLLFALKGFINGSEIFLGEWIFADPVSSALDFAILMSFFAGLLGK